jgi:hypothetical protein
VPLFQSKLVSRCVVAALRGRDRMTSSKDGKILPTLSRRRVLIAGSAVAATAAAGGIWIASRIDGPAVWIEAVVRRHLPGLTLDPVSLATFIDEFSRRRELQDAKLKLAVNIDQAVPAVTPRVAKLDRRIDRLERLVVTSYLVGSNFFRESDPHTATIVYGGELPACGNPFAKFRDA